KMLVVGGVPFAGGSVSTAEIFDPAGNAGAGTWTARTNMLAARYGLYLRGIRLNDVNQRVLVFSGLNAGTVLSSSEIYDPTNNAWTGAGAVDSGAPYLYSNGPVVALHGTGKPVFTYGQTTYIYDPVGNAWSHFYIYDGSTYINSRAGEGGLV